MDYWRTSFKFPEKLIKAFLSVPREEFIEPEFLASAYGDYPLPIPAGQTISQPTTVMIMIKSLELKQTDIVLEVGAGSGYCAAIMSRLCRKVITTEIIPELAAYAKNNLKKLRIQNVNVVEYDGSQGYKKEAPYDKIMVTAACPSIPPPLVDQLKVNGIIVAPVGAEFGQEMIRLKKAKSGNNSESLGCFNFVPLKGKFGYGD